MKTKYTWLAFLALTFAFTSCKKDEPVVEEEVPEEVVPYHVKVTIDDTISLYNIANDNGLTMASGDNGNYDVGTGMYTDMYILGGFYQDMLSPSFDTINPSNISISYGPFSVDFDDYITYDSVFNNLLLTYASYYHEEAFTTPGFVVTYNDASGVWGTQFGSQATSSLIIKQNEKLANSGGLPNRDISGLFSCILYNENDPTQYKFLTSGSFKLNYKRSE